MIQLPDLSSLTGVERFGLDRLIDLSRLLPALPHAHPDLVRLEVTERGPGGVELRDCIVHSWYLERSEGVVSIPRAVLALVGAVVGAAAEQQSSHFDRHGRVPPSDNALVAGQLEKEPVISQAALSLRDAVRASAGRRPLRLVSPWPGGRRWAAAFTHDLDLVALWPLAVAARVAELVRKREFALARQALASGLGSIGRDPVRKGVRAVLDCEAARGVPSTWFVICETPTMGSVLAADVTYRPESRPVRRILRTLLDARCEIGLHGSFATADRDGPLSEQRQRLSVLTGSPPPGVRQHFLRMRPGVTHVRMEAAGFQYDSTFGFSDRNGFRLGVADVIPVWDAERGTALTIEEAPFCWMDRALSKYQAVEQPSVWVDDGVALAERCRAVEGLWVGVWHPNLHPATGFPGSTVAFERLVSAIVDEAPFLGTLSEIVAWRVSRRQVRGRAIRPNGEVEATIEAGNRHPHRLEDISGLQREPVRSLS